MRIGGVGCLLKEEQGKGKARRPVTRIIFTLPALHGNSLTLVRTRRSWVHGAFSGRRLRAKENEAGVIF